MPWLSDCEGVDRGDTRKLFPAGLQEQLLELQAGERVDYTVTDFGLLPDLSNHHGSVGFEFAEAGTTLLRWQVRVSAPAALASFWEVFIGTLLGAVSRNLAGVLRQPWGEVVVAARPCAAPEEALEAWVDFIWHGGGGLPGPKPEMVAEGTRLIQPPGLLERITNREACRLEYCVENPCFQVLYPVVLHEGVVEVKPAEPGCCELLWTVRYLPVPFCDGFVNAFTGFVVRTLAKNLEAKLCQK